jgi:hypothetical protein
MGTAPQRAGRPGFSSSNHPNRQAALDRELAALEKRKLVELRNGTFKLTREGYVELIRRFPQLERRRS